MFINKNKTHIEKDLFKQNKTWYIIDATNKTLGRLSSQVAYLIRGKNNNIYTPYQIQNINIIIINSSLIKLTGKKREQLIYKRHSGRPGGLKIEKFNDLQKRLPNKILEKSIKGMLPKNILGRQLFKQLKIYSHDIHPHSAQKPITID
uniref:Ribosomal protein L13 n=1 Tax=Pleonosporium borreri TaxID=2575635 RepID=A0A4D6WXG0_9FLOR|nr:ribosomal protein L13 [Pleonosporium borreri]